uniref:Uncharacterized protein AlNc14C5G793 n=1 Tax=Albugo laibachii Nc14 TaxID=890382 RepID=F0W113_9STRA|nr:conserved hypothetical protein [Albugo laibachii Nc14]|eukprot:CCA14737.1 conserved hypothetical protein [Albugo laibachii Nc14]
MSQDEGINMTSVEILADSNPYLDCYNAFLKSAPEDIAHVFNTDLNEETRRKHHNMLDVQIAMKYAWAIPDERALKIIKSYGPIVEMGAGTGYWAKLLELRGVDIVCYDLHGSESIEVEGATEAQGSNDDDNSDREGRVDEEGELLEQYYWTKVWSGTPEVLSKHTDRTLLLCYPDDFEESEESMALNCLEHYNGDTIIHVGEWLGQTLCLPDAWGRTSSPEFQVKLSTIYHKVLQVPLPSWHSSMDTLTVWKRTRTCIMDDGMYAYIPPEERLDLTAACSSTRHLLVLPNNAKESDLYLRKRSRLSESDTSKIT